MLIQTNGAWSLQKLMDIYLHLTFPFGKWRQLPKGERDQICGYMYSLQCSPFMHSDKWGVLIFTPVPRFAPASPMLVLRLIGCKVKLHFLTYRQIFGWLALEDGCLWGPHFGWSRDHGFSWDLRSHDHPLLTL